MNRIRPLRPAACVAVIVFFVLIPWTVALAGPAKATPRANPSVFDLLSVLKKRLLKNGLHCFRDSRFLTRGSFHRRREPFWTALTLKWIQRRTLKCPAGAARTMRPKGASGRFNSTKACSGSFTCPPGGKASRPSRLEGDRLLLFNDPVCHETTGIYAWKADEGQIVFRAIEDECAIRLRAMNLTKQPWLSCRPPNTEAATTGHWPEPPGCR